jgi:hypothetical protein
MGMSGISRRWVSRPSAEIDNKVKAFHASGSVAARTSCVVHWRKTGWFVVSAFITTAFLPGRCAGRMKPMAQVANRLRPKLPADSDEVAQAYRYEVARGFRDDVAHLSDLISPSGEAFWPAGSLASVKPRGQSGIATSTFFLLRLL